MITDFNQFCRTNPIDDLDLQWWVKAQLIRRNKVDPLVQKNFLYDRLKHITDPKFLKGNKPKNYYNVIETMARYMPVVQACRPAHRQLADFYQELAVKAVSDSLNKWARQTQSNIPQALIYCCIGHADMDQMPMAELDLPAGLRTEEVQHYNMPADRLVKNEYLSQPNIFTFLKNNRSLCPGVNETFEFLSQKTAFYLNCIEQAHLELRPHDVMEIDTQLIFGGESLRRFIDTPVTDELHRILIGDVIKKTPVDQVYDIVFRYETESTWDQPRYKKYMDMIEQVLPMPVIRPQNPFTRFTDGRGSRSS